MAAKSRLRTAIDDGLLSLPGAAGTVVRPPLTFDLAALSGCDLRIVETFSPDVNRWSSAGFAVASNISNGSFTIVNVPRSKPFAKSLIAQAAAVSDLVVVDGDKTNGIDSIFKICRKELGDLPSVTKDHGRIFWFEGTDALAEWVQDRPIRGGHEFYTLPGVFSEGAIDKGSEQLLEMIPDDLTGRIADLGSGWGYLSSGLLNRVDISSLTLVEAEKRALDCARMNIDDARATFLWEDATIFETEDPFDAVVMNPPFHIGRDGDPALGQAFIKASARILKPKGTLWMVANRHLPYEATLAECFHNVVPYDGTHGFKLFKASRPKR